jgi:uncharacterized protein YlzI (FlbEa/FlbD family)
MQKFKILNGLPAYGPLPEQFSSTGMGKHREGFVVEFFPEDGQSWIGNFQPGLGGIDDVIEHINGDHVIILSNGQAYVVDPETRSLINHFGSQIEYVTSIPELKILLFGNGLWFEAIGESGFIWQTRRLSWDGMRSLHHDGMVLSGEGYDPMADSWVSFTVDLSSGDSEGGSYCGPKQKFLPTIGCR